MLFSHFDICWSLDELLSEASLAFNKTGCVDFSESQDVLFVFRLISNSILIVNVYLANS